MARALLRACWPGCPARPRKACVRNDADGGSRPTELEVLADALHLRPVEGGHLPPRRFISHQQSESCRCARLVWTPPTVVRQVGAFIAAADVSLEQYVRREHDGLIRVHSASSSTLSLTFF